MMFRVLGEKTLQSTAISLHLPMERKNHDCDVSQFRIPVRQKFRYLRFRCKKPSFAKIVNQAIYLPAWNPVGFQECEFVFKSLAFTHGYWRRCQALTKIPGGSNNIPELQD